MAMHFYQTSQDILSPMKYGVDPVGQLAARLKEACIRSSTGSPIGLSMAGFICPLYQIDESRLEGGFSRAITGIGREGLEQHPRYKNKFERLLTLTERVSDQLQVCVDVEIIMGDKGVINLDSHNRIEFEDSIEDNLRSYETYLKNLNMPDSVHARFSRASQRIGGGVTDLHQDGQELDKGTTGMSKNERVFRKVANEVSQNVAKGKSKYEPLGFAINYGLAGVALQGVDILVGTDMPGSYMNYLYHAFIDSNTLLLMVPK